MATEGGEAGTSDVYKKQVLNETAGSKKVGYSSVTFFFSSLQV